MGNENMFLSLYRSKIRTRKWYHRIAFNLFALTVANGFIIHRETGWSLLNFTTDVCRSLLAVEDTAMEITTIFLYP